MKQLIIFVFVCLITFSAQAQIKPSVETWLESRGNALIRALSNKDAESRYSQTRKIAEKTFHQNELSKLALGRYWAEFTPEEQSRFRSIFMDYFLAVYTKSALPVKDINFQITDKRETPKDVLIKVEVDAMPLVKSKEAKENPEKVKLEMIFALRERSQDYYIRDVQVEGQSMLMFVRSEIEKEYRRVQYVPSRFLDNLSERIEQRRFEIEQAN